MISKNERKCTYLQKFLKKKKQGEKYILDNFFSLKNDEQMSKRQKPAKIFLCPPIPLTLQILYKERKKKLDSFEETPPSSQLNASCEKMELSKSKKKRRFFSQY